MIHPYFFELLCDFLTTWAFYAFTFHNSFCLTFTATDRKNARRLSTMLGAQ